MSSLLGDSATVWTLRQATDALARSARRGAAPSGPWVAGFVYQGLSLGWTFGMIVALPVLRATVPTAVWHDLVYALSKHYDVSWIADPLALLAQHPEAAVPVLLIVTPIVFRFASGLARIAPTEVWDDLAAHRRAPRLRRAWLAGKGVTAAAIGLWLQMILMMFGAALLFLGPPKVLLDVLDVSGENVVTVLVAGVAIALILFYSFLLSILFQIALHSLVQNRRGVGSALLHAWRLAKNDPMATARATLVDAVLYFTVFGSHIAIFLLIGVGLPDVIGLAAFLVIEAVAGCTRCAYWAEAYRALGGISTVEPPQLGF